MMVFKFNDLGPLFPAYVHSIIASFIKPAPFWSIDKIWNDTRDK